MLSKLLKYEIKATARLFLPLLAVLLVFAGVNKLIMAVSSQQWQAPQVISMILYITIFVGILVMTLVVTIQRFYKNLLSDEGYLMFTLPTKAWKHITSKLVVAMLWTVASGIAAVISIFIIAGDKIFTAENIENITNITKEFFVFFGASSALIIFEFILLCVISLVSNVLIIYASIALGHLFNRHKILASLGAFIVLSTVTQILFVVAGAIPGGNMNFNVETNTFNEFLAIQPFFHSVMWYCIIFFGLLSAGYFALTNYILSKRLNLE